MGNKQYIRAGEVQIMSAGSGLTHSEYNGSDSEPVNFLQIWVFPKERDIEPRYDQKFFSADDRQGRFQNIVSPDQSDGGVLINQDAWFWLGDFVAGQSDTYSLQKPESGCYVFVLEGSVAVADEHLERRDGLAIENSTHVDFQAESDCSLLLIEVPMN